MKRNKWYYKETACFPKKYKVQNDYYVPDNASHNFFETELEAVSEVNKRNKEELNKMLKGDRYAN